MRAGETGREGFFLGGFLLLLYIDIFFFSEPSLKIQGEQSGCQSRAWRESLLLLIFFFHDKLPLGFCCVGFLPSPRPCWGMRIKAHPTNGEKRQVTDQRAGGFLPLSPGHAGQFVHPASPSPSRPHPLLRGVSGPGRPHLALDDS